MKVIFEGLSPIPEISKETKEKLRMEFEKYGLAYLYSKLMQIDSIIAQRLPAKDKQRILRALEVYYESGIPLSEWHRKKPDIPEFDKTGFFLNMDRSKLYNKIEKRIDEMIEKGWIEEVKTLINQSWKERLKEIKSIGYIEIIDYLDNKITLEKALSLIKKHTRWFAKRQITWFKREKWLKEIILNNDSDIENFKNFLCDILIKKYNNLNN